MEEKSEDTTEKTTSTQTEPTQGYKTLQDAGELKFRRIDSQDGALNTVIFKPISVLQRKNNTNFIIAEAGFEHQIYKIENQTIKFVSNHKVDIPIRIHGFFRVITENHLRYCFPIKDIEKRNHHIEFFKEHKIDWKTDSNLVFELEYGIGKPRVIKAKYLGEMKKDFGDFEEWNFMDMFDNQKALFNRSLSLFKGLRKPDEENYMSKSKRQAFFLAEFGKQYTNLSKRVFQFNLPTKGMYGYEAKLSKDKLKVSALLEDVAGFYDPQEKFYLENWEPGEAEKLKPFIKVDKNMLTIGLVDFRKKVVPVQTLVSIYELLGGLDLRMNVSLSFFNITTIDYSIELDLLILEAWFNFQYSVEDTDELKSVIGPENGVGDQPKQKRSLLYLNRYQRESQNIFEITKARFKVWNVYSKEKRRVEIENLGYRENSYFKKNQGTVTTFDEDQDKIKIEVFSKGVESEEGLEEDQTAPKPGGVSTEDGRIEKTVLEIPKQDLLENRGINCYGVRSAFMINQNHLLIASATKMLLYDIESKDLLSDYEYCKNAPYNYDDALLDQDILITPNGREGYIEVLKISITDNSPSFRPLGIIDLKSFDPLFHSIKKLIAFRKIDKKRVYELKALVKWMNSTESDVTNEMIYSLRFELPSEAEGDLQAPKTLEGSIDLKASKFLNSFSSGTAAYLKNRKWYFVSKNYRRTSCLVRSLDDTSVSMFRHLSDPTGKNRYIDKVHLKDNKIYLALEGRDSKLLALVESPGKDSNGKTMVVPVLKKSMELPSRGAEVYFDEVTELFRIFLLGDSKEEKTEGKTLKVLDEELEVVDQFLLPLMGKVERFSVINQDSIHLIFKRFREVEEDVSNENEGVMKEDSKVSLILNLTESNFKRLVVEGEGPLFGPPHDLGGGQLLGFTEFYNSLEDGCSDGIYVPSNNQ